MTTRKMRLTGFIVTGFMWPPSKVGTKGGLCHTNVWRYVCGTSVACWGLSGWYVVFLLYLEAGNRVQLKMLHCFWYHMQVLLPDHFTACILPCWSGNNFWRLLGKMTTGGRPNALQIWTDSSKFSEVPFESTLGENWNLGKACVVETLESGIQPPKLWSKPSHSGHVKRLQINTL